MPANSGPSGSGGQGESGRGIVGDVRNVLRRTQCGHRAGRSRFGILPAASVFLLIPHKTEPGTHVSASTEFDNWVLGRAGSCGLSGRSGATVEISARISSISSCRPAARAFWWEPEPRKRPWQGAGASFLCDRPEMALPTPPSSCFGSRRRAIRTLSHASSPKVPKPAEPPFRQRAVNPSGEGQFTG